MVATAPTRPPQRAAILEAIQPLLRHITIELDALLQGALPSNHHLNAIVKSLAWRDRRQTPALRLAEMERELKRLSDRAGRSPDDGDELKLYEYLLARADESRLQDTERANILNNMHLMIAEKPAWEEEFDLALAQATVQILKTLVRTRPLRQELSSYGGNVAWQ
jgi:hypothetical protein